MAERELAGKLAFRGRRSTMLTSRRPCVSPAGDVRRGGPGDMLDLHCHILPGVDDGAASLDEALAMARFCVRDGITHVVATPHCHRHCRLLRRDILPHVARLNEELARTGVPLVVLPGSEIQVSDAYRSEFEAGLYCHLGDGRTFTLLEFNWKGELYPPDAPELVGWLCKRSEEHTSELQSL